MQLGLVSAAPHPHLPKRPPSFEQTQSVFLTNISTFLGKEEESSDTFVRLGGDLVIYFVIFVFLEHLFSFFTSPPRVWLLKTVSCASFYLTSPTLTINLSKLKKKVHFYLDWHCSVCLRLDEVMLWEVEKLWVCGRCVLFGSWRRSARGNKLIWGNATLIMP